MPGSPGTLSQIIQRTYDPTKGSLEHYEDRLMRQQAALNATGEGVPASIVDNLLTKARIISVGLREKIP